MDTVLVTMDTLLVTMDTLLVTMDTILVTMDSKATTLDVPSNTFQPLARGKGFMGFKGVTRNTERSNSIWGGAALAGPSLKGGSLLVMLLGFIQPLRIFIKLRLLKHKLM